uniref:Uncharacterized protein n=1 Tax=Chromera velia CCMP2878 TaxID=1169474 RepID=A0A0G4I1P5_9ALVE|eukprot:Cvel_1678.t1-p1 / transcript=Cvel_1678.t1 / gene=Cvel_1678 / organism=Chromera_velia_CCMP2878 / gene_product=hypothetical protein / transcript_product=hypothetical protein / location=Cvel_scaffold60:79393-86058(-) / protein_length=694 / sequence_SO=supercontig / SO=protein_coding / is_pseudo=false
MSKKALVPFALALPTLLQSGEVSGFKLHSPAARPGRSVTVHSRLWDAKSPGRSRDGEGGVENKSRRPFPRRRQEGEGDGEGTSRTGDALQRLNNIERSFPSSSSSSSSSRLPELGSPEATELLSSLSKALRRAKEARGAEGQEEAAVPETPPGFLQTMGTAPSGHKEIKDAHMEEVMNALQEIAEKGGQGSGKGGAEEGSETPMMVFGRKPPPRNLDIDDSAYSNFPDAKPPVRLDTEADMLSQCHPEALRELSNFFSVSEQLMKGKMPDRHPHEMTSEELGALRDISKKEGMPLDQWGYPELTQERIEAMDEGRLRAECRMRGYRSLGPEPTLKMRLIDYMHRGPQKRKQRDPETFFTEEEKQGIGTLNGMQRWERRSELYERYMNEDDVPKTSDGFGASMVENLLNAPKITDLFPEIGRDLMELPSLTDAEGGEDISANGTVTAWWDKYLPTIPKIIELGAEGMYPNTNREDVRPDGRTETLRPTQMEADAMKTKFVNDLSTRENPLKDRTMREISSDYGVDMCFIGDMLTKWGQMGQQFDLDLPLKAFVEPSRIFDLGSVLGMLDPVEIDDWYLDETIERVADHWKVKPEDILKTLDEDLNIPIAFGRYTRLSVDDYKKLEYFLQNGEPPADTNLPYSQEPFDENEYEHVEVPDPKGDFTDFKAATYGKDPTGIDVGNSDWSMDTPMNEPS